jgi:adenine-specific DNA methylase
LLAVVRLKPEEQGRHYRVPREADYQAVWKAQRRLKKILDDWDRGGRKGLCPVPDEPTPTGGGSGAGRAFSVQKYGMLQWGDLFTARQKLALHIFAAISRSAGESSKVLGDLLALMLNHTTERCSSLCRWSPEPYMETILGVFARQALPMIWDFAEAALLSESTGSFLYGLGVKAQAVQAAAILPLTGQVQLADASPNFSRGV